MAPEVTGTEQSVGDRTDCASRPVRTDTITYLHRVNLSSSDVPALAERLTTYVGYRIVDSGTVPAPGGSGTEHFAAGQVRDRSTTASRWAATWTA